MDFNINPFTLFDSDWSLLTAGDMDSFNSMTVSWGSLGTLWGKPVATVYVKPARYTHGFMEDSDYFTLGFFDEKYRPALMLMGTKSGRDTDKPAASGLTPVPVQNAVTYMEAHTTLLCRKLYRQDLDLSSVPPEAMLHYRTEAPHTVYIGEVVYIIKK